MGLAVDDIKGVQEKAVLKRLAMQVYVLRSEPIISSTTIMYSAIFADVIVRYCFISTLRRQGIMLDKIDSKQLKTL